MASWRVGSVVLSALLSTLSSRRISLTPFTCSVATQLVVQTVTVTDKDGKPIEGLTADDFILTEDNVPQTISVFEFEKLDDTVLSACRASAHQPAAVDEGPSANPQSRITPVPPGDSRYQDRRLLALYFDMAALGDDRRFRALAPAQTFIDEADDRPPIWSRIFTYRTARFACATTSPTIEPRLRK